MNQHPQATPITPPHTLRPWPLARARSPKILTLQHRLSSGEEAPTLVAELLAEGTPILEPATTPGETLVTFAWQGEAPHGVLLQGNRLHDILDPADTLMARIPGTDLHTLTLALPTDWIGGYQFLVLPEEPRTPQLHTGADRTYLNRLRIGLCTDPHAREHTAPRKGTVPQAVGRGPAATSRRLDLLNLPAPTPTVNHTRLRSVGNGAELVLHHWSHPRAGAHSPTLLLLDGEVWQHHYPLLPTLQAEMAVGQLPPLQVLLLESGGPRQRQVDYLGTPAEIRRFLREVLAAGDVASDSPLIIAGQSMGGLFAMRAGTFHPDLVAAGIAQSPSLWWPIGGRFRENRGQWFRERAAAVAAARRGEGPAPAPLLLHNGLLEWDLADDVRHAAALLEVEGALIGHRQFSGGHEVLWWQQGLPDAVQEAMIHLGLHDCSGGGASTQSGMPTT